MTATEDEHQSALVAFVGGARPATYPDQVAAYLLQHHGIPLGDAQIHRYWARSFLTSFRDDQMEDHVLHATPPIGAALVLIFGRYRRQQGALFSPLRFKVLLALDNVPTHVWLLDTMQVVVKSSCLIFDMAPSFADGSDTSHYRMAASAVHPDLIPMEGGCAFPKPGQPFLEREPPLFISASKVIHSKQDTLQLLVFIRVVEIHDLSIPTDSDDDPQALMMIPMEMASPALP
jgi:hypothetical protein